MAQKIFAGQTTLRIQLRGNKDLRTAVSAKIKYRKPDGTFGEWVGTINPSSPRIVFYDLSPSDVLTAGIWKVWASITFPDGRTLPGTPVQFKVFPEGSSN